MANGSGNGKPALMGYLPVIVIGGGLVASGAVAQYQIGQHEKALSGVVETVSEVASEKVSSFIFDLRLKRIDNEFAELEDAVEKNAEAINELIRNDDKTDAKLQLEIERIRTEIERSNVEQANRLQIILDTLERQRNGN